MGWFVVLIGLAGMAYFAYFAFTMLKGMETEIRSELDQATAAVKKVIAASPKPAAEAAPAAKKKAGPVKAAAPPEAGEQPLEEQILKQVKARKGVLQTEFYGMFPNEERRVLQKVLAAMDAEGTLRREKEKSTYRLFPGKAKKS